MSLNLISLSFSFCFDKFQSNYKATIGVDFELENFNILGHNFNLEM